MAARRPQAITKQWIGYTEQRGALTDPNDHGRLKSRLQSMRGSNGCVLHE